MARRRTLPSPAFGRARHTDMAEAAERRLGRCPTGIEIAQIGCQEGAAGLDTAKIATIALHTAPASTRDEIRRCAPVFLCPALDSVCSAPPISLSRRRETRRASRQASVLHAENRHVPASGRKKFPAA